MNKEVLVKESELKLTFWGGTLGALVPFLVFLPGVVSIALSGAPDEKGFWPVLIFALGLGLLLARDKQQYSETIIEGMSQKIVMIMILAWMLASMIGVLMSNTGFVDALVWLAHLLNLNDVGFVLATFIICCVVSLSTGSSFATILICGPILYPPGGLLGAHLPTLAGAIIGGATFGDFVAPISDTTIASSLSQDAKIGQVVKSRVRFVIPVLIFALAAYGASGYLFQNQMAEEAANIKGDPKGLPMLLVPALIIFLFLKGKHLMHGLLFGLLCGTLLAWVLGLLPFERILSLDLENFTAKSFMIDGINRAVGISFFTILLMGMVQGLKASGLIDKLIGFAQERSHSSQQAEGWIAAAISAAVLLTTHSIVAILMVADFAKATGEKWELSSIRRANILGMIACFFPFVFPYFIPVILMSQTTSSGAEYGIASVGPMEVGLYNFVAWGLLSVFMISIIVRSRMKQTSR